MKLSEKYAPLNLSDIVGQPPVRILRNFARNPYSTCFMLEGPRGVGKTSSAIALAHDLGCSDEVFGGLFTTCCSDLGVDQAKEMLRKLSYRPGTTSGFVVWLMEEMDYLSPQCQTFLKDALEKRLPQHAIVVACTNDPSKIKKALLDRFTPLFYSGSEGFLEGCEERLRDIWDIEMGMLPERARLSFPSEVLLRMDSDREFSMRRALDAMQRHMLAAIDFELIAG